jgi:putative Mn2+ efflux pump MntP
VFQVIILAVVLSMAAAFTLSFIEINAVLGCVIIGVVTFFFSWIGVCIGSKSGTWLECKAGLLGGHSAGYV